MRGAAVGPDVLVSAILVSETPQEGLASHTSGDVGDGVFACAVTLWKFRKKYK